MTTAAHQALDAGDVTKIGVAIIVALIVLGFLISIVITAIIGRIVTAVVVVALAIFVWTQRNSVEDKVRSKACGDFTFVGVHLDPPDSLKNYCARS